MKVQLLLLLALAGPLCSFTRASPTVVPTDENIITGPTPTRPQAVPVITGGSEAPLIDVTTAAEDPITTTFVLQTVAVTIPEIPSTESPIISAVTTLHPTLATSLPPMSTEDPALKTTVSAETDPLPLTTETTSYPYNHEETTDGTGNQNERLEIEDDEKEGLSTGHIVGIVIAAIVAVVIVGAVMLALWRRMGKYSP